MEFNFNKIRDLMRGDNNQSLPPEFDWNNMKDGIFDKMQSIEQEELSQKNKKRSRRKIGFFLLLFFALVFGLFSISQKVIKDQAAESSDIVQSQKTDISKNTLNNNDTAAPTNRIEYSDESFSEKILETKVNDLLLTSEKSDPNQNQDSKESEIIQVNIDQLIENQCLKENDTSNKIPNAERIRFAQDTLNTTAQNALSPLAETETKRPNLAPRIPVLPALPMYSFNQMSLEEISYSLPDAQQVDSIYFLPSLSSNKSPNQLILEGGITFWDEGYGNNKPEKAQYETTLTSFQLQGHYVKSLKGNYFVMAGLQYQQLESRFNYNTTIQDYKITVEDTIIQVQNYFNSGEQRIIRGDVEQSVQAERRVIHYNTTKLLKVSLAAGKTWRFNSFQTDVYLGGALNSWVHNQGRMFYEDAVTDYNGTSNAFLQNQSTIDGVMGARLHYFLSQNIGLTAGFQSQKSLMNWSKQDNINSHPVSFSLQLGLSYSLY